MEQKNWYAIYVKPRHEKKVSELLSSMNIENYIPVRKELRQWSDRKKLVETVVFSCYVFVKIPSSQRLLILKQDSVSAFVRSKGKDAVIPDNQIEAMKKVLSDKDLDVQVENGCLTEGEEYEVLSGVLKGKVVKLQKIKGKTKACICIEDMNLSLNFDIDSRKLRRKP